MKTTQELHRKTFELTLALYRVTDFFPQGEALRRSLREKANEIFGNVTEYEYSDNPEQSELVLLAKVETMKGYLRVARSMQLVRPVNLTILEREYGFLEHFFKQAVSRDHTSRDRDQNPSEISFHQQTKQRISGESAGMTDRQKKILDYVEKTPQAKISDFYNLLASVSVKTIQRDLHDLVQRNILKKEGQKRWTLYSIL